MKEIEPYIELRLEWRKRHYKNGKMLTDKKYFKFKDCTIKDMRTPYQRLYFSGKSSAKFCVDDPNNEIYLSGNRDSTSNYLM